MSKKIIFIPVAILSAAVLAVPTVAAAKPSIGVTSDPSCAGFSFTAASPGDGFGSGRFTVTAQTYDSETVTPAGEEQVFTGDVTWGETINVTIPTETDYLLWTYRVDSSADGQAVTTYGERQLDCRIVEEPVDPEEPGEDIPLIPLEPATPVEEETDVEDVPLTPLTPAEPIEPEPSTPEPVEPEATATPEPTHAPVVVPRVGTAISTEAAVPVVVEPRTAG